ncbi:MAG: KEOPS complex subunit Pcc1 [Promethearchaeota archaeon]
MNQNGFFSIKSWIELKFNNSEIRDLSYNSFIPEIKKLQTNRSKVFVEKKDSDLLIFKIEGSDITAFRASINEIINFGKIIDNTVKLTEIS